MFRNCNLGTRFSCYAGTLSCVRSVAVSEVTVSMSRPVPRQPRWTGVATGDVFIILLSVFSVRSPLGGHTTPRSQRYSLQAASRVCGASRLGAVNG